VKLVVRDQQGQLSLSCPICRQVTPVPGNGVRGLQSAINIIPILELLGSFENLETSSLARKGKSVSAHHCSKHVEEELKLYCETCSELICLKCAIKGGEHHSHDYLNIEEAFEEYRREITASLKPIEKQLATASEALAVLDARCVEISDQRAAIEDDLHRTFRQLREVLDVRETKLTNHLHEITQKKLKALAIKRDEIETTQAQLSSCLDIMKDSIGETEGKAGILKMKTIQVRS